MGGLLLAGVAALLPALMVAGPPDCSCNGFVNSKGQGECQTTYKGKRFCYVEQGKCGDERKGASSSRYWSYEACKRYGTGKSECHGLSGEKCVFPFKWDGRTFNNCTTYKSQNGAAWCATRVRGSEREAVRGKLEDCSAPCDYGARPYGECPRSPVVKGLSQECCTPELPCRAGEGDCDTDADCHGGLKCGDANCARFRPDNYARADCCYDPYSQQDYGKDKCRYGGRTYDHGETFAGPDSCNRCRCQSGEVTCTEKQCGGGGYGSGCTTVGGPDVGAACVFPFTFKEVRYTDCTTTSADDGKAWCSTKTDYSGAHVGGGGHYGHCPRSGCGAGESWGSWGSWGACSATCGGGGRTRRRTCSGRGGCRGEAEEEEPCSSGACGSWGAWGGWGACSNSCGRGVQKRSRSCGSERRGGVLSCDGESMATRGCTGSQCGGTCRGQRVRRNVNSLGRGERQRLVDALQDVIRRGEYEDLGNFHGSPGTLCGTASRPVSCCPHGTAAFLPWHRLYMVQMEETLGEALPYWDWTEDSSLPGLWEGVRAPIQEGARSQCGDSQFAGRDSNIRIDTEELQRATREAFMEETFEDFSNQISSPHGLLHVSVGCDMFSIDTAAYDPVFYLHHAYVDYQFAFWQELQRLRGHGVPNVGGSRLEQALAPFNNRQFNDKQRTLANNLRRDTLDYKNNYCYEYDDLKFMGMSPAEFLDRMESFLPAPGQSAVKPEECGRVCRDDCRRPGDCRQQCEDICVNSGGGPPAKVYVGLVLPKMALSGLNTFDLCQAGRCVPAGKIATFGAASSDSLTTRRSVVDKSTHYIAEYEVTAVLEAQGWNTEKALTVRMTSSPVSGLPAPVVILKYLGATAGRGEVALQRGQRPADYGDLLDKYDIIDDVAQ